jgi:hypothetical protein
VSAKNAQSPRLPSLTAATRLLRSAARHGRRAAEAEVRVSSDFLLSLQAAANAGTVVPEPIRIEIPGWNRARALKVLRIQQVAFAWDLSNRKGYATGRTVAVSPFERDPHLTLFHEIAHVVLGHVTRPRRTNSQTDEAFRECHAEAVAWLVARALGLSAHRSAGYISENARLCGRERDPFASWWMGDVLQAARRILTAGLGGTADREVEAHERTFCGVSEMREAFGVPRLAAERHIPIAEAQRHFDECDDAELYERICDLGDESIAARAGLPTWVVERCMADQCEFGRVIPPARLTAAVARFQEERRSQQAGRHQAA